MNLKEIAQGIVAAHTAAELIEASGANASQVSQWKSGKALPSVERLDAMLAKWPVEHAWPMPSNDYVITATVIQPPPAYDPIPAGTTIMVLTPTSDGRVSTKNAYAVDSIIAKNPDIITRARPVSGWNLFWNRNRLVHEFLQSPARWAFWVDGDTVPPCGKPGWFNQIMPDSKQWANGFAGINGLARLIQSAIGNGTREEPQRAIVGGVYFLRNGSGRPVFQSGLDNIDIAHQLNGEGPRDAVIDAGKFAGTGCLLMHKSVFIKIMAELPQYRVNRNNGDKAHLGYDYDFFRQDDDESDDAALCMKAARVGFKTYVDCAVMCGHLNEKCIGNAPITNF